MTRAELGSIEREMQQVEELEGLAAVTDLPNAPARAAGGPGKPDGDVEKPYLDNSNIDIPNVDKPNLDRPNVDVDPPNLDVDPPNLDVDNPNIDVDNPDRGGPKRR